MKSLTANLQITISNFILDLEDKAAEYWLWISLVSLGVLLFLALFKLVNFYSTSKNTSLLNRISNSHFLFALLIFLTVLILRLPGVTRLETNPDEGLWVSAALTLIKDPRFWITVDGSTGGPLVSYPLTIFQLLGDKINYGSAKLLGILIWAACAVFMYYTYRRFFTDSIARLIVLPLVACVASFTHWDYVAYNSEHIPILLLSASLFLYSLIETWQNNPKKDLIFFIAAFILGCLPYAKLQAVPMGLTIALFIILFKSRIQIIYAIAGGIAPTALVLIYLFSFNAFDDFWQSYIVSNFDYASKGVTGNNLSLVDKLKNFPEYALIVRDSKLYFIIQFVIFILTGLALLPIRKNIPGKQVKLIILAGLLICSSILGIVQPGNIFHHYILFLVLPAAFLPATMIGTLITCYQSSAVRMDYAGKPTFIALVTLIAISVFMPLSRDTIAFEQIKINNYTIKMKSPVAEKILEYAKPGEQMAQWGWANRYYAETGLRLGTRDVASFFQMKANQQKDYYLTDRQQNYYLNRYITDLQKNKPVIFIEAVGPNQFAFIDSVSQSFNNFPMVRDVINEQYNLIEKIDGVKIYVAKHRKALLNLGDYVTQIKNLPKEESNIQYNIEYLGQDSAFINISGWSFIPDYNADKSKITLILQSDSIIYRIKTKIQIRPDVTGAFKSATITNLDESGFLATIPKSSIKPGKYKIGINIKSEDESINSFLFTDKTVDY